VSLEMFFGRFATASMERLPEPDRLDGISVESIKGNNVPLTPWAQNSANHQVALGVEYGLNAGGVQQLSLVTEKLHRVCLGVDA